MAVLGTVGVLFILLAGPIVGLFTQDPVAWPAGALGLRTMSFGFVFYALGMVLTQAFNGAGDTWTPTFINLGCFWLWEIPLAYVLARVWGPRAPAGHATGSWVNNPTIGPASRMNSTPTVPSTAML